MHNLWSFCRPYAYLHNPFHHRFLLGDGANPALIDPDGGGVGRALLGGGGSGPVGGGALAGKPALFRGNLGFMLELLLCRIDELDVRGGNSGLLLDSIVLAGSGMLSLLLNSGRLVREYCPFAGLSSLSRDRCCKDNGGCGDF